MQWTVGRVKITNIVEIGATGGTRFILPQATPEEAQKMPWLVPHYASPEGRLKLNVQSWIVETPTHKIIVDTCIGNDKANRSVPVWNGLDKPFLNELGVAGYPAETIDTVLCTHLHVDHVGWNTKLWMECGCRLSPTPATCSEKPSMTIGPRTVLLANTGRCSRIRFSRLSMPDAPT